MRSRRLQRQSENVRDRRTRRFHDDATSLRQTVLMLRPGDISPRSVPASAVAEEFRQTEFLAELVGVTLLRLLALSFERSEEFSGILRRPVHR